MSYTAAAFVLVPKEFDKDSSEFRLPNGFNRSLDFLADYVRRNVTSTTKRFLAPQHSAGFYNKEIQWAFSYGLFVDPDYPILDIPSFCVRFNMNAIGGRTEAFLDGVFDTFHLTTFDGVEQAFLFNREGV